MQCHHLMIVNLCSAFNSVFLKTTLNPLRIDRSVGASLMEWKVGMLLHQVFHQLEIIIMILEDPMLNVINWFWHKEVSQ